MPAATQRPSASPEKDRKGPPARGSTSSGTIVFATTESLLKLQTEVIRQKSKLEICVNGSLFELVSGIAIVLNICLMCMEVQHDGLKTGHWLELENYDQPPGPQAARTIYGLNVMFNVIFIIELVLRLAAEKLQALKSAWIWFDIVLVSISTLDLLAMNFDLNPTVLRTARLARMWRVVKVIREAKRCESMFLLLRSAYASLPAMLWSFTFLTLIQVTVGLCVSKTIAYYTEDETVDIESRRQAFEYFGTFNNTMLTMFELTLANWTAIARFLYMEVHVVYGLCAVLYRCLFIFGLVRVITAVFIAETNRVAARDDELELLQKQRAQKHQAQKLRKIFLDIYDVTEDGRINFEEFKELMKDTRVIAWATNAGITRSELDHLFHILDDGGHVISLEEFTESLNRMKGPAKSIDLVYLLRMTNILEKKIDFLLAGSGSTNRPHFQSEAR
eukprot:gnl/TRDRNA2_/TRDRNA2_107245_c0_seq2.p1 gnl/TRDRNA2_/TRDRNA2_107245_c0~~gnl/TRDRNA2_/TRDRNA2_107245_c0_seq2.p1  ORF type:complete len:490 (+),score=70.59 gnl/TRDRNA2_/TRDRNA2_107245_c0_seq2:131-1471(+)